MLFSIGQITAETPELASVEVIFEVKEKFPLASKVASVEDAGTKP